jgi:transmembrane sensor
MPNNKLWELIAKKLSGEATENELVELEKLMRYNPDMHYPLQTVADLWHHATPDTEDSHLAFSKHTNRMRELGADINFGAPVYDYPVHNTKKTRLRWSLAAVLLLGISYYFYSFFFPPAQPLATDKSEVSTKYGSRTTKLILPDSTQVWLNAGSKLSYNKSYGNGLREVSLSGEAYFDVVKNPAHPFIIHTSSIDIKVLGTAFNVKSFPGEKNTETSLIRGSIEVTFKNRPAEKIILKPNEKLITANNDTALSAAAVTPYTAPGAIKDKLTAATKSAASQEPVVTVSHITYAPRDSTVIETSWMEHKLIFRSETFEELAIKMERWYGVNIRFADNAIKPKKLNGIFENETILQALQALQLITPFSYKMNRHEIVISSK